MSSPALSLRRIVTLQEQLPTEVLLSPEEAAFLAKELRFDVATGPQAAEAADNDKKLSCYLVNPRQFVGHFVLSTDTIFVIRPKLPAACVFKMIAYVYASWKGDLFRDTDVLYATDEFIFEPFVELFNDLVQKRIRRGLFQDYIDRDDNLTTLRGQLQLRRHIQRNVRRNADRVYCRYFEHTCDVEDNQIIKWTLARLPASLFSVRTAQGLRANFQQFEPVTLVRPSLDVFDRRHYHRLNEDYRFIHSMCKLFLDSSSISELVGQAKFRGFLLDMNHLYEAFVTQAFISVAKGTEFSILAQHEDTLCDVGSSYFVTIRPDVVVTLSGKTAAIIDAKYKRAIGTHENPDFYQVVAYGTGLSCSQTHLFYPASECDADGVVYIKGSPIQVQIHRVDIENENCIGLVESAARHVLKDTAIHQAA